MQTVGNKDFKKIVDDFENLNPIISNKEINLIDGISIDLARKSYEFRNCIFKGGRIDFYDFNNSNEHKNDFHTLSFKDCKIENDLFIKNCRLYQLVFQNVKITSKNFFISHSDIQNISIIGNSNSYNSIESLLITDLNGNEINLDFRLNHINNFNINDSQFDFAMINKNKFKMLHITNTKFVGETQFWRNEVSDYLSFRKCTLNNLEAKESDFGKEVIFEDSDFLGNCNFENSKNSNVTSFKIEKCNFNKYVYFDSSKLFSLVIDSAFFREMVSFQNTVFHKIKFNRTHFEKIAHFNDIQIASKNELDLNTIRIIKTQLLKTENKIDYLEFKKYEFELYRKSLSKNKNGSRVILWLNKVTSDYNTNWITGIIFTLGYGYVFYQILYLLVFGLSNTHNMWEENKFWVGYFKYLIIPNFNSPFSDNDLNKWYQYLFFILGKIAITYGLYETIQSFRKYGKT